MSKHGFDISKFKVCATHGTYAGNFCPKCEDPPVIIHLARPEPDPFAGERATWWKGPEKELHDLFAVWLEHYEVEFVHSRTDKPSTVETGLEDFVCLYTAADGISRACFIEFKNHTGKLRKDQVEVIDRHRRRNLPVLVTGNFQQACDFVKTSLQIPEP